jgi:hypothetical protein
MKEKIEFILAICSVCCIAGAIIWYNLSGNPYSIYLLLPSFAFVMGILLIRL